MHLESLRDALVAFLRHPIVVPSLILLVGINAAIWMAMLERVRMPAILAWLMLVPPLTFLLPIYVVLARWPNDRLVPLPARPRAKARPVQRVVRNHKLPNSPTVVSCYRRPVLLDSDGLPRHRIALPASTTSANWPF